MTGTIFRLPDDLLLQRGLTYTIMPDGRSLRVPAMNRLDVRSEAQNHEEDGDHDMRQALQDILMGKKPVKGRAHYNRRGVPHGNRVNPGRGQHGGPVGFNPGDGIRPVVVGGDPIAEM